jgi:hypothetical protein
MARRGFNRQTSMKKIIEFYELPGANMRTTDLDKSYGLIMVTEKKMHIKLRK